MKRELVYELLGVPMWDPPVGASKKRSCPCNTKWVWAHREVGTTVEQIDVF
jgi:hypothetical protein